MSTTDAERRWNDQWPTRSELRKALLEGYESYSWFYLCDMAGCGRWHKRTAGFAAAMAAAGLPVQLSTVGDLRAEGYRV
jgi:hypothetical protein